MDPLSDVLAMVQPRSHVSGRFEIGKKQTIQFSAYEGIKCYAVISGACWLVVEGVGEAVYLEEGDCFLLASGRTFSLSTDRSAPPVEFAVLLEALMSGKSRVGEPGAEQAGCVLAGGHFLLGGEPADLLLGTLPPIVHLQSEAETAAMRWSLDRMREELRNEQLGGVFAVQQLAYMMLVQALRVHLTDGAQAGVGWLYALTDPQMKKAIVSMHATPAYPWTVEGLAAKVGMSRSIFAMRFKTMVGSSPMEYLTRWRMLLAGERLTGTHDSVIAVASSLGYQSESAFGKAFKRVMKCSPRQYCRQHGRTPMYIQQPS